MVERLGATSGWEALPADVRAVEVTGFDETMAWLEGPRALVPGDCLIGDGAGGLRLPPASWLEGQTVEELRDVLRRLLADLPVEQVLCSHWAPVLRGGRRALDAALAV